MPAGLFSALTLRSAKRSGLAWRRSVLVALSAVFLAHASLAQFNRLPSIQSSAGNGTAGYGASQNGGPATSAELSGPRGVATDRAGNVYIVDSDNNLVRRVDAATGIITTVAGNGTAGFSGDNGPATSAMLNGPGHAAVDSAGNLYIGDVNNNRVRRVDAVSGIITTVAGNGTAGYAGDDGPATSASLNFPQGVAVSSTGILYISDYFNYCVREVSPSGVITTAAGNCGNYQNPIYQPVGLAVDAAGNLFIGDEGAHCVRKFTFSTSGNTLTTVAGTCGTSGYSGDGAAATGAQMGSPDGIALDSAGNLYIADSNNNHIRKVTASSGIITTLSGTGTATYSGDNGLAVQAGLSGPFGIAVDADGNILIADRSNNRIRKIPAVTASLYFPQTAIGSTSAALTLLLQPQQSLQITKITVATSLGGLNEYTASLSGCALNANLSSANICTVTVTFAPQFAGEHNVPLTITTTAGTATFGLSGVGQGALAALTPGILSTVAGTGTAGFSGDGGAATSAQMNIAYGVTVDQAGNMYVADGNNNRIRRIDAETGVISTVAGNGVGGYNGDGGPATLASINQPHGTALDPAGNLYIADFNNFCVRVVSAATQRISTFAGRCGTSGYSGDGGAATAALFNSPRRVAFSPAGDLYIADSYNACIRKVNAGTGIVTTVAGICGAGGSTSGDGGPAVAAKFNDPHDVTVDQAGNVFVADNTGHVIRKIAASTGIITTVAGNGTAGFSGDGSSATAAELNTPHDVVVDPAGNLYIADSQNNRVRQVSVSNGMISTIAGTGTAGATNGPATSGTLQFPAGLALDGAGTLYISEEQGYDIRQVVIASSSLSFPTTAIGSNGGPQTVAFNNIGNAPLIVSIPSGGSNPTSPADFTLDAGSTTCPIKARGNPATGPVAAGASCTYGYLFTPQHAGTLTETSSITDISLNKSASQTVALTGTATAGTPVVTVPMSSGVAGGSVTLTASVAYSGVQPTGAVTYSVVNSFNNVLYSGTMSCTSTASPLSCSVTIQNLGRPPQQETYQVTVTEAADNNYVQASGTGTLQVAVYSATLSVAPVTVTYGTQTATLSATVGFNGPNAPTGQVAFVIDGGASGNATCGASGSSQSCSASYPTATLSAGNHTITATQAASQYYNATTATATLTVQRAAPAVAASLSSTSVSYGTAGITATAALSYPANAAAPSGAVTFTIDGTTAATVNPCTSPCSATLPTNALSVGTHSIVASMAADTNYSAMSSPAVTLTVTQATPVITGSISASSVSYGTASVTVSATVMHPANAAAPSGAVTFSLDGAAAATVAACAGTCTASLNTTALTPGSHTVGISIAADANYTVANSSSLNLTVTKAQPVLTASITPASLTYGTPTVTFNASVTHPANATAPAGAVTVAMDGVTAATIASCASTCTTTLNTAALVSGTHTITASLAADTNYLVANSTQTTLTVTQAQPSITVSLSPSSITFGAASVTLTANITHPANTVAPGGAVTVTVDGVTAATIAACGNTCGTSLNTSKLAAGPHTIIASLAGDANYKGAASPAVVLADAYAAPSCSLTASGTSSALTARATVTCTDPQKLPLTATLITWGDGLSSQAQPAGNFTHTYASAGTYTVSVTSTDSAGLSGSAQAAVTPNQSPVCTITTSPISTALTAAATVSCKDPQNLGLTATLAWGDGTTITVQPAGQSFYTYKQAGTYTVSVTATDTAGLSGSAQQAVTPVAPQVSTNPAYKVPVCTLNTITSAGATNTVGVSASCTGQANDPVTQTLNWGDSAIDTVTSANQTYTHSYGTQSTQVSYTVTLTATGSVSKLTGSDSKTVLVSPNVTTSAQTGTASQTYTVAPQPTTIQVTFTCLGVTMTGGGSPVTPSLYGISCNQPQATASPNSTASQVTVTIQATPATATARLNKGTSLGGSSGRMVFVAAAALFLPIPGAWIFGMGLGSDQRRRLLSGMALYMLLLCCFGISSCGGSFTAPPAAPTPSGRYYLTIAESVSGGSQSSTAFIQNSLIVPLCVQGTSGTSSVCP